MADRRPKLLVDALSAIGAARQFIAGHSLQSYEADLMLRSAVERQMEILGEACMRLQRLDPELSVRIPSTRLVVALRDRIIHGYDSVDDETVFDTVTQDLATLALELQAWLEQISA
jgi:uncharacterized protein with HEPN domain